MATRALAGNNEVIASNETYVSSAIGTVTAFLPKINDGTAGTVAVATEIRIETTGSGAVQLVTLDNRAVGTVPPRSQAVVVARSGAAQGEPDSWTLVLQAQSPAAFQAVSAAYTQAEVVALRDCLVNAGLMKAE